MMVNVNDKLDINNDQNNWHDYDINWIEDSLVFFTSDKADYSVDLKQKLSLWQK